MPVCMDMLNVSAFSYNLGLTQKLVNFVVKHHYNLPRDKRIKLSLVYSSRWCGASTIRARIQTWLGGLSGGQAPP